MYLVYAAYVSSEGIISNIFDNFQPHRHPPPPFSTEFSKGSWFSSRIMHKKVFHIGKVLNKFMG